MTAVTANQVTPNQGDCMGNAPVYASTHLYQLTLAFINATGYLVGDTGSGVNKFFGICKEEKDNSGGSSGDLDADCYRDGIWHLAGTGFSQASVGLAVYAVDNNTVTTDGTTANAVYIGVCARYISSTLIGVEIEPQAADLVVASGKTLVVTTADKLTVGGVIVPQDELISVAIPLHASKVIYNLFVARTALQVLNIEYTPDIAQGGALTATVVKASGTATPASATTPMHIAAAINLNGTAHTVQPITLSVTTADTILAAGDRIGLVLSGAMTTGSGTVTIRMKRV